MTESPADLQTQALRAFTCLTALREDWRGALVLGCGLGGVGSALSIAANIAGAGCLAIDPRVEMGRAAMRLGACDFVVNTVDEALRVLKNEIRQRRPVSVGLTLDLRAALAQLVDRGVLPELFAVFHEAGLAAADLSASATAAQTFGRLGSVLLSLDSRSLLPDSVDATAILERFTQDRGLQMESFSFISAESLKAFDGWLRERIPDEDPRRRWCESAPRMFHRERPCRRVVFLSSQEREEAASVLR